MLTMMIFSVACEGFQVVKRLKWQFVIFITVEEERIGFQKLRLVVEIGEIIKKWRNKRENRIDNRNELPNQKLWLTNWSSSKPSSITINWPVVTRCFFPAHFQFQARATLAQMAPTSHPSWPTRSWSIWFWRPPMDSCLSSLVIRDGLFTYLIRCSRSWTTRRMTGMARVCTTRFIQMISRRCENNCQRRNRKIREGYWTWKRAPWRRRDINVRYKNFPLQFPISLQISIFVASMRLCMGSRRGFICRMKVGNMSPDTMGQLNRMRQRNSLGPSRDGQNYVVVHCTGYIKNWPPTGKWTQG